MVRTSIFDLEMRVDIAKEFENIGSVLYERDSLYFNQCWYSLYDFLNDEIFPVWENKGLFMDLDDFLDKMKIDFESNYCSEVNFLYLLEVMINLWPLAKLKLDWNFKDYFSKRLIGYMDFSIPLIIEKLNYQIIDDKNKFKIIKRDSDVDSILDIIPPNYSKLLLEYNDIRNNNKESKISILKSLDKLIELDKKEYKSLDSVTYNSIQIIVNNMGVNHPISKEPYKSFSEIEIIDWYNKCFKLMIHIIRRREINEINKVIKGFTKD